METIKQVLMNRDEISAEEADEIINDALEDARMRLDNGESIEDICEEFFGLEPDFFTEFLAMI